MRLEFPCAKQKPTMVENPVHLRMSAKGSVWLRDKFVHHIAPILGALKLMKMGKAQQYVWSSVSAKWLEYQSVRP